MSLTISSMIRILLIQCFLTALFAMPLQQANAVPSARVVTHHESVISARVNSYIFEGEKIDLKEELMLESSEKIKVLQLRAQGIEDHAQIAIEVDDHELIVLPLENRMKTLQLKLDKPVHSLKISSNAAFLRGARARVQPVSDEPHPEDVGHGFWSLQMIK